MDKLAHNAVNNRGSEWQAIAWPRLDASYKIIEFNVNLHASLTIHFRGVRAIVTIYDASTMKADWLFFCSDRHVPLCEWLLHPRNVTSGNSYSSWRTTNVATCSLVTSLCTDVPCYMSNLYEPTARGAFHISSALDDCDGGFKWRRPQDCSIDRHINDLPELKCINNYGLNSWFIMPRRNFEIP